jgi:hypothetical protein
MGEGVRKRYDYLLLSSTCVCRSLTVIVKVAMGSGGVRACHPCSLCRPRRDRTDTLESVKSIESGARTYHLYRRREVEVLIRLTACYKRVEEEIFRPGGDFLG